MTTPQSTRLLPPPASPSPLEDQPTPSPAAGHRSRGGRRSWSALLVLLVVVAAAAYGGYRLVEHRVASASEVTLDEVLLVAEPVPVGSPDAAVVRSVVVDPGESVAKGARLAVIQLALGGGRTRTIPLTAPVDANVVKVDAQPGSVVRAGESVVTLYEPDRLTFQTELPVEQVEDLTAGMTARITGPGLSTTAEAVVDRVVPVIDGPAADNATMTVILVPTDESAVRALVPGVPLTGTLDTTSAPGGGSVLDAGA